MGVGGTLQPRRSRRSGRRRRTSRRRWRRRSRPCFERDVERLARSRKGVLQRGGDRQQLRRDEEERVPEAVDVASFHAALEAPREQRADDVHDGAQIQRDDEGSSPRCRSLQVTSRRSSSRSRAEVCAPPRTAPWLGWPDRSTTRSRPAPDVYAFYDGAGYRFDPRLNWVDDGALSLGIASYAIVSGSAALVYDTHVSLEHARRIRALLEDDGARTFTVVLGHWHLDHVAGTAAFADSPVIWCERTAELLTRSRDAIEAGSSKGRRRSIRSSCRRRHSGTVSTRGGNGTSRARCDGDPQFRCMVAGA